MALTPLVKTPEEYQSLASLLDSEEFSKWLHIPREIHPSATFTLDNGMKNDESPLLTLTTALEKYKAAGELGLFKIRSRYGLCPPEELRQALPRCDFHRRTARALGSLKEICEFVEEGPTATVVRKISEAYTQSKTDFATGQTATGRMNTATFLPVFMKNLRGVEGFKGATRRGDLHITSEEQGILWIVGRK